MKSILSGPNSGPLIAVFAVAMALVVFGPSPALAHESSAKGGPTMLTPELKKVRDNLAKYKDVTAAEADGYVSLEECVAGPEGAMGVHYLNQNLIGSIDPAKPAIIQYQPVDGGMDLVGVEWLVMKEAAGGHHPRMFGRKFAGPMPGHEPAMPKEAVHYDLHAWLFVDAPTGVFADFNPNVKCPAS